MNYDLIKTVASQKNLTIEQVCDKVGITSSGFYYMVKNDSMKIKDLEKIAEVLKTPISYFFGDTEVKSIDDYQQKYIKALEEISALKSELIKQNPEK